MNIPQNFANVDTALEFTRKMYPEANKIEMIDYSCDNIVALVDTSYAVRFPRNKNAYLRGVYEKHILKQLEKVNTITIPLLLDERSEPPCLIASFVPGNHISAAGVRAFSQVQQQDFAKQVARFVHTMYASFRLDEELLIRQELGLDKIAEEEPWPIYFKRIVHDTTFPTSKQDEIAKSYYNKWVKLCDIPGTVVVHDDLHTQNMMFENNRLIGILDFGDTNIGTPEQELRQLYRINEEVMLAGVQEYQKLSGQELDIESLKTWSIMKELAVYYRDLTEKNTSHHAFKRACRNLNTWLPEGEWGQGYDIISDGVSQ